jgi:RND family efflux transporter MFP subunit
MRDVIRAAGSVVPSSIADQLVTTNEPAEIVDVAKNEGDKVEAGDVLVRVEIASITNEVAERQIEMSAATLKYEAAKAEEARLSKLHAQGYAARNQWEAARNTLATAENQMNQVRSRLDAAKATEGASVIRAKFAGVVIKSWHKRGEMVAGGEADPILRVVDPTKVQVALLVPIEQADRVQQGQPVTIQSDLRSEPGTIAMKAAAAGAAATTIEVRATFVAPTTIPLDAVVQAEIVVEERPNVLMVPANAIQRSEDSASFVWIATPSNQASKREVRVGLTSNGQTQILSGVAEGDQVILTGIAQLAEGTAIAISR